jgi:hypothetical protein
MPNWEVSFMKKALFVVVLALALTFALAMGASATTGKFFKGGVDYYTWSNPTGSPSPGTAWVASGTSNVGSNTVEPGVHANYLATTAKCGICHSVHRAAGDGTKLLPTADASCAGCHTGGTAITAKIITWSPYSTTWVPEVNPTSPLYPLGSAAWMAATGKQRGAAITNSAAAGGLGGPHNDNLFDLVNDGKWDGTGTPPLPDPSSPLTRYGCWKVRCHATNPHGANSSQYKLFAAKLLFNTAADDDILGDGTYGGLDAVYDADGATDASVQRFAAANSDVFRTVLAADGKYDIEINKNSTGWRAPDPAETHAIVAGLTCGRPANMETGSDNCHCEASYAVFDKSVAEMRNHATRISGNDGTGPAPLADTNAYRTDNTGEEWPGTEWYNGGNDHRDLKTGHVAGTFAAVNDAGSYAAISGCTSCHDQTDSANTVAGHFTFPHGQTAYGTTNLVAVGGGSGTGVRSRIWAGWGGFVGDTLTVTDSTTKAYDGQCLKCHRDGAGNGIGLTK